MGLAEVLAALRRSGVPMQRIRPALQAIEAEIGLEHALASRRLFTDGVELLFDYADAHIAGELLSSLVVVRSGQRVSPRRSSPIWIGSHTARTAIRP